MAGIKITLIEDVSSVVKGSADVARSFDKVADSLDDVARDAQRAGDDIARGIDGGTDDAAGSVDQLERSFRDMAQAASRSSKQAGDDVGDNVKKGYRDAERAAQDFGDTADRETRRASDTTDEFKDEARANFSEVASSFTGDMSSAVDVVQGTLGGLAGSIPGGVGLALGGLALGAGAFAQAWSANAEKVEQRISDMFDDMLQSGADYLSKDYIAAELSKIYQGADDAAIKVKELRDLAAGASIPEPLLARALVGDKAAREQVKTEIAAQRLKINEALDDATSKGQNLAPALAPAIQALQDIEDRVDGTGRGLTQAQQNADAARRAIDAISAPTQGVAASAEDARSKFDGLGRQISALPTVIAPTVDTTGADETMRRWRVKQATLQVGVVARPGVPQAV